MKALEKVKEMIDFCNAIGCHRALYESLEYVQKELEEIEYKSCRFCKYEEEKIKLYQYNCLPYPCRECARCATDRYEQKETL